MRDRTEKMIGGVSVLLLLFMVTRWKLFEYAALILWIVHLGSYLRRERKANLVTIWYAVLRRRLLVCLYGISYIIIKFFNDP